jgi:hypothetical protein
LILSLDMDGPTDPDSPPPAVIARHSIHFWESLVITPQGIYPVECPTPAPGMNSLLPTGALRVYRRLSALDFRPPIDRGILAPSSVVTGTCLAGHPARLSGVTPSVVNHEHKPHQVCYGTQGSIRRSCVPD